MGETRVDLHHLLEDLRDAYPGTVEETILTEIAANSLDSGARRIRFFTGPGMLTVIDDGRGMKRRELARYHDIAASTKTRGEGIGFAGVGIKLGLLICDEVITETRRGKTQAASRWSLASRHRAPWKWIPPTGILVEHGTSVCLRVANPLSPLLDPGFIEASLLRHFEPLLDPRFRGILGTHYPSEVVFEVNGLALRPEPDPFAEEAGLSVRLGRRRKPSASGYLVRSSIALPEDRRGLGISTFGKVIKRGWDWLGITPAAPERYTGLVEAPGLAQCLTLNKADFFRSGPRGAVYLTMRKALQEAIARQLAAWGDAREPDSESRRATRPLERDLERVLFDLAEDFPLLASLVNRRTGSQGRLSIASGAPSREGWPLDEPSSRVRETVAVEAAEAERSSEKLRDEPESESTAWAPDPAQTARRGGRKPARLGLSIQFEDRPGETELSRLIESTVWINASHPAFRRAVETRSQGYHAALAVALALAPLAVEPAAEHGFITRFLAQWGRVVIRRRG